ncbi:MAG: peptide deformylase [bacterium]|nr:peptide deformylase [bacterium]
MKVRREILPESANGALRQVAREIPASEILSATIQGLISDMKKLLAKEEYGVALAAPQVGEPLRLFIVSGKALSRGSRNAPDEPAPSVSKSDSSLRTTHYALPTTPDQVYINPVMTKLSREKSEKHEGCLSVRGKWGEVLRSEKATVQAYDTDGRRFARGASGFLAHIFQHEMDHLEGILYTDKATHVYDEQPEEKSV